jgi:hypothetical protein
MRQPFPFWLRLPSWVLLAGLGLAAAPPTVDMVPAAAPPVLDGRLDDAAWQGKPKLSAFVLNKDDATATAQTEVLLTCDDRALYLGVRALEPNLDNLVTQASAAEAVRVWSDDVIEVFLDTRHDRYAYVHLGITANGITAAQRGSARGAADIELGATVATGREAAAWILEVAVPFSGLGAQPQAGEIWGLNLCRGRPKPGEYSSWAGVQGPFGQTDRFGLLRFPAPSGIAIASRGLAAPEGNANGRNVFTGSYRAPAAGTLCVEAASSLLPRLETRLAATAGQEVLFELPYRVQGAEGEQLRLQVTFADTTLYATTLPVSRLTASRVWITENPLYKELLGDSGPGLAAQGAIMWAHELVGYEMATFCLKYAQPYVLEEYYRNAARRNLRYIMNGDLLPKNTFSARDYADTYGLKFVLLGNTRAHAADRPIEGDYGWLFDPANQEVFLREIRDYLAGPYGKYVWAVMTADEFQEWQLTSGLRLRQKGPYPYLDEVDREVRERFGFGKFGLPTSLEDKDPCRWIAYRRWLNAAMLSFQKRLYETVKDVAPQVLVIGPDPLAAVMPLDYSGYSRYTDLMTNQLYPRHSRWEQDFAWITKTIVDLSGKPTLPCAHVENYGGAFTPDEAREMLSQVYRAGGQGFHLYLPDTAGKQRGRNDLRLDRNGSPPRWETVMGILDLAATTPRPTLPPARAALLYSNDAHMGEYLGEMKGREQYRWLFNLLGPIAGGWFKVIDDEQISRGDVTLSEYEVLYVPHARHQRRAVVQALRQYVQEGGVLVVLQPDAFTWDLDGTRLDDLRTELLGPGSENPRHQTVQATGAGPVKSLAAPLPLTYGRGTSPTLTAGASAILAYEDGQPAAVERTLGKGRVLYFGFDPLYQGTLNSPGWRAFFGALHAGLGQAVDLPIWRFTFPAIPAAEYKPPPGRCLTNNFVRWDTNEMIPLQNVPTAGTYTYSLPPDLRPDEGGTVDVPFAKGNLTDRRTCLDSKDAAYWDELARFAAGWKATGAFTITFDLGEAYPLDRVWLLFSGQLPALRVEGRVADQWRDLGGCSACTPKDKGDFPAVSLALDPQAPSVRQVRLSLGERPAGASLIIPEIEIWARD